MALTPEEIEKLFNKSKREVLEDTFALQLKSYNIHYERQYRFHPTRMWRFDFAIPSIKLGIEIDGGTWMAKSGHTTGRGYQRDREKDQQAIHHGWTVLRFTAKDVKKLVAIKEVRHFIGRNHVPE